MGSQITTPTPSTADAANTHSAWKCLFTARPYLWFALLAFALRAAVGLWASTYGHVLSDSYYFGCEEGSIARSIFVGEGFSSPFRGSTGPSAWVAPVYPMLIALSFKLFGVFSQGAWNAMVLLNCLFAGLTCIPMYMIGRQLGQERIGAYAGLIWSGTFSFFHWPTTWIWDTSLNALQTTLLLWMGLDLGVKPSKSKWFWFGILWGVSALTNPGVLALMPALVLWPIYQAHKRREDWIRPLLTVAILFVAIVSPWLVRNERVFHRPVFIRSNFGFEFWLGNSPMMTGFDEFWKHPILDPAERRDYVRLGEIDYVQSREQKVFHWIAQHPGDFLKLTGKRIVYFWYGTPYFYAANRGSMWNPENFGFPLFSLMGLLGAAYALRVRAPGAIPFASVLFFHPLVYYISYPNSRYRHAVEPLLLVLAVYLVLQAKSHSNRANRPQSKLAAAGTS